MKTVHVIGLDEAIADMGKRFPARIDRARKSALSSVGYMIRTELRNHVEYGGTGWPSLHPLSAQRKKDKAQKWRKTSKRSPLYWLGKFARYIVDERGEAVVIDFGKSRAGQAGKVDAFLSAIARKHESGSSTAVTAKTRKKMALTYSGKRLRKGARPGVDFFPLRKSTTRLRVPKRPSVGPVFRKVQSKIPGLMREKFFAALQRYATGGSKA